MLVTVAVFLVATVSLLPARPDASHEPAARTDDHAAVFIDPFEAAGAHPIEYMPAR